MNDFQKKNRSFGNDKKFDPARRPYPANTSSYNSQYRNSDKQGANRRKAPNRNASEMEQQTNILAEVVTDMKGLLESISQSNKRMTEMEERRVKAEERQTAALERIAEFLTGEKGPQPSRADAKVAAEPDSEGETDPETAEANAETAADTDSEDETTPETAEANAETAADTDSEGETNPETAEAETETAAPNGDAAIVSEGKPDDDEKRKIVLLIHERREAGLSYGQIASQFADEKIPTFSGKGNWHPQTIRKIDKLQPGEI